MTSVSSTADIAGPPAPWRLGSRPAARAAAGRGVPTVEARARAVAASSARTWEEAERAPFVRAGFAERGLAPEGDTGRDVSAGRAAARGGGALLLAAHTDTVFPRGT